MRKFFVAATVQGIVASTRSACSKISEESGYFRELEHILYDCIIYCWNVCITVIKNHIKRGKQTIHCTFISSIM